MKRLLLAALAAASLSAAEPYALRPEELPPLAAEAPKALRAPITTVADKPFPSPGGDVHDYVSYARYYWPDPAKPDGLPYVQRDGHHNREQVAKGDRHRIDQLADAVLPLAAAWRLQRDETAARRAGEWLRAWYVTPATRMNPHLEFAQVRLGHSGNRGNAAGVLDTRAFAQVVDALQLLDDSPALSSEEKTAIRAWFGQFTDWLLTAPNARAERAARNNHATWYFAQAIPLARYAGRTDTARELAEDARSRIGVQIQPDGSQPEEIRRVDGLGYSRFNLEAYAAVARQAAGLGVDFWNYTAPNGASLRAAVAFLQPYNADPAKWPHSQREKLPAGFLDTLLREAGAAPATPAPPAPASAPTTAAKETTPTEIPGTEAFVYRDTPDATLRLFVVKPAGWKKGDRRAALMFFFGGGWTTGTPRNAVGWAKAAAALGLVGIAPDYRTKTRFGTSPLASVADSRAALRWAQDHAEELGLDPQRIVVGGNSAGGHVALWTAITATPPGSAEAEAPRFKPAALVLYSTVSDTSPTNGYTPQRFGEHTTALSPVNQLDPRMPPVIAFHGDADKLVPLSQATALRDKLVATGNVCELHVVPGGGHNFGNDVPEWRDKSRDLTLAFLRARGLVP